MSIHTPPFYRYPLFDPWDKEAFEFFKIVGENQNYPSLIGSSEDANKYLIALIRTQKALHDYRSILMDTITQVKETGAIDTALLHAKYPPESISTEIPAWVTYKGDRIVNDFIDSLADRRIKFVGTNEEISEFILRFILGQLGHDWESTILMLWENLGDSDTLVVKELNEEMKKFDYCKLFK
jgi:hypothetical protein